MRMLYWVTRIEPRVATLATELLPKRVVENRDLIYAETPNHAIQVARMTKVARQNFNEEEKTIYAVWNEMNRELDK